MTLSPAGQNPRGTLSGNRDRARRPCEGFSDESATGRWPIREWRGLHPAGFGPGKYETPQAEARATRVWLCYENREAEAHGDRYVLRKPLRAIDGAAKPLCYDFLQFWPSRGVHF
jgi:hypothetical protein